jgi:hypothetical protein
MRTISLKLPEALDARLAALAQQRNTSKSEIVREALSDYLSHDHRPLTGSFLSLAKDLVGCIDGPIDLAANKAYLQGYGR